MSDMLNLLREKATICRGNGKDIFADEYDYIADHIEALEAKLKKVCEELDCVKHYDCASEIGKPCNCDLADVYKALKENEDE